MSQISKSKVYIWFITQVSDSQSMKYIINIVRQKYHQKITLFCVKKDELFRNIFLA